MADNLTAELAKAKRIADTLQFACILPGRKPDFTFCGGPAAGQYCEYFTPARIVSLLAAVERILELHRPEMFDGRDADGQEFGSYECITCDNGGLRDNWPCGTYLAITSALTGEAP